MAEGNSGTSPPPKKGKVEKLEKYSAVSNKGNIMKCI